MNGSGRSGFHMIPRRRQTVGPRSALTYRAVGTALYLHAAICSHGGSPEIDAMRGGDTLSLIKLILSQSARRLDISIVRMPMPEVSTKAYSYRADQAVPPFDTVGRYCVRRRMRAVLGRASWVMRFDRRAK